MIVTIDGPAGAGKSSVAKMLAKRLGFEFLDTGAMYRAVAWAFSELQVDLKNNAEVDASLSRMKLAISGDRIWLNDKDVTRKLRSSTVSQDASIVATLPAVRNAMVQLQRETTTHGDFVCEGRDQGTVVFPDAVCKIFLTATPEIRAERRWRQMTADQPGLQLDEVIAEQKIRDLRDETRSTGRLEKALDAIVINVDCLSMDQIVGQIEELVRVAVAESG